MEHQCLCRSGRVNVTLYYLERSTICICRTRFNSIFPELAYNIFLILTDNGDKPIQKYYFIKLSGTVILLPELLLKEVLG